MNGAAYIALAAKCDAEISRNSSPSRAEHGADDWPELLLLPDVVVQEPSPFPFSGLGPLLGPAAESIARDVQAPDALAGASVLASASLAAQAHADVLLPHGQRSPLSLTVISSIPSGERKSATDGVAGAPIEETRRQQARQYTQELADYEATRASRSKSDPEPPRPTAKSLTVGKATVEGLHMILRGQSHIGLFTAEGAELFGGHSLREDRRSAGLAWLLKAWGGETLDTLTRGDGLSVLLGRRVSMHAMVQPVLLRQLLSDPLASGQGFLARCLISEPRSRAGTRLFNKCDPKQSDAVQRYYRAIERLLNTQAPLQPDGDGSELNPAVCEMEPMAEALWIEFYNAVELAQAEGRELAGARAFASKAAEQAARIAAVIDMVGKPGTLKVTEASMAGAIEVMSFYINEHVRLTGSSQEQRRMKLLTDLLEWLRSRRAAVPHEDVLQRSPNPLRQLKAAGLKPLIEELTRRGYIRINSDRAYEVRPHLGGANHGVRQSVLRSGAGGPGRRRRQQFQ